MTNKAILTFVCITYREIWEPYMFIGMLKCMKNENWRCIIWHDEPNSRLKKIVEDFRDDRITYVETENRGSWGCYNRIDALKMVDTEFVVNCTIQEYYIPNFIDLIEEHKQYDFIYWPVIHHSFNHEVLSSEPVKGKIDWSNFAIKAYIARKVGINYPDAYMADGVFVEECMASGFIKKKIKIPKILTIKN